MRFHFIVISSMLIAGGLGAETKPFAEKRFDRFLNGSEDGSRFVEGHCEPRADEAETMRCSLTEGVLLPPKAHKPFAETDGKQVHQSLCGPDSPLWSRLKHSDWAAETRKELDALVRFCKDRDLGKLNAANQAIDSKTCRFVSFPPRIFEFRRTGPGKWSARFKESGECKVSGSYELEQFSPNTIGYHLTMRLESARQNDPEVCAEIWNKPEYAYRMEFPRKFEGPCALIEWVTPID